MPKWFASEVIGTFIMVFLGLGIVAGSVTSDATEGIFQIAAVWGLGLACAIYLTTHDTYTIPSDCWHKTTNIGKTPAHVLEVQYGDKCEEEDIQRKK